MTRQRGFELLAFLVPGLLYLLVSVPHLDFVPMWDGMFYARCIVTHGQLSDFFQNCFGHPAHAWLIPLKLLHLFFPDSMPALNIGQIFFGLIGVVAFQAILKALWPSRLNLLLNLLIATVYAINPVIVGNMLNATPDNGMLAFYLCFLASFLHARYGLAALFGLFLFFSKEPGIGYYLVTIAVFGGSALMRSGGKVAWKTVLRQTWVLIVSVPLFALAHVINARFQEESLWVGRHYFKTGLLTQLIPFGNFPLESKLVLVVALQNFAWVTTGLVFAMMVYRIQAKFREGFDRTRAWLFLLPLFLYISTRFIDGHPSPRYVMICFPIILLAVRDNLESLANRISVRGAIGVAAMLIFLNAGTLYSSVDPVSTRLFGTFGGSGSKLYRSSLLFTKGSESFNRDELIYNLQFTNFHRLFNKVLEEHCLSECQLVTMFNYFGYDYSTSNGVPRRVLVTDQPAACFSREDVRGLMLHARPLKEPLPCLIFVGMPNCSSPDITLIQTLENKYHYKFSYRGKISVNGYSANIFRFSIPELSPK